MRSRFHQELDELRAKLLRMGGMAEQAVDRACQAYIDRDLKRCQMVLEGETQINIAEREIDELAFDLLAMQQPMAVDLRFILAVTKINADLERVGDQAVNIAKLMLATRELPTDQTIVEHLAEMGDLVVRMLRTSIEALVRRDIHLALRLPEMDDPVDLLNRNMYRHVVALADDPRKLEWGVLMDVVSRQLERVGDNAVDIGEQVSFLLTGEFREFTDASHDVSPLPLLPGSLGS